MIVLGERLKEMLSDLEDRLIMCPKCNMPFDPTAKGSNVVRGIKNQDGHGYTNIVFTRCSNCGFVIQDIDVDIYQPVNTG